VVNWVSERGNQHRVADVGVVMRVAGRIACTVAFVFAAVPVVLAAAATPATACSCLAIDDAEAFSLADAVFTGAAVERHEPRDPVSPTTLVFHVDHVYKGDVAALQEVRTPSSSAACGLSPTDGRLLVFAADPGVTRRGSLDATDGQLVAFLCGGTRDVSDDAVPVAFGTGRAPAATAATGDDGSLSGVVVVVVLAAVLVIAIAAAVAATRRRPAHSPSGGGANP
jgi:hypothetical protein